MNLPNPQLPNTSQRLEGLDLARFLALIGMVIVNFNMVMVSPIENQLFGISEALQGRAAALFVILAGLGLGLSTSKYEWSALFKVTLKRFVFLLVLGLLNMLIFEADIIHYYAFYFLFGVFIVRASNTVLWLLCAVLIFGFVLMTGIFDYDKGWYWPTYSYLDFWTGSGFIRNLFFNGWHPVFPWLSFLIIGIFLSRINLHKQSNQWKLLIAGSMIALVSSLLSVELIELVKLDEDPDAVYLFGTDSVPPMPLYSFVGTGIAMGVIAMCLLIEKPMKSLRLLPLLTPVGRQSLTWYMAHIIIGMGILEAMGMLGGQTPDIALWLALIFSILAVVLAYCWNMFFKRGPLEGLMRKLSG
ncbi:MAG: heparan-alpha-glucosaminide N-acetyltransferase domain-containing protein [Proteobacteria bacterium]|nr:heparan-alpha-glucosaminide N-acetyltransferase domain-containing protein [Pseudomonadota bacterium]